MLQLYPTTVGLLLVYPFWNRDIFILSKIFSGFHLTRNVIHAFVIWYMPTVCLLTVCLMKKRRLGLQIHWMVTHPICYNTYITWDSVVSFRVSFNIICRISFHMQDFWYFTSFEMSEAHQSITKFVTNMNFVYTSMIYFGHLYSRARVIK